MKPPILETAVNFGLAGLFAAAGGWSLSSGGAIVFAAAGLNFALAVLLFIAGVFGLYAIKAHIAIAELQGEQRLIEDLAATRKERSR